MPKDVDHRQRRHELADAVLRLVARGGVGSVTLREAAVEAGWSTGALNHYFKGKTDMLVGAVKRAIQLIGAQIRDASAISDPRTALVTMLTAVLPIDDTRVGFARAWLSFCGEAVAGDDIRMYLATADAAWRSQLASVIRRGQDLDCFERLLDPDWVADSLAALVDGLSTRTIIQGKRLSPNVATSTVQGWVDVLVPQPTGAAQVRRVLDAPRTKRASRMKRIPSVR